MLSIFRKIKIKYTILNKTTTLSKKDFLKEKDLRHFKSLFGLALISKDETKVEKVLDIFLTSNFSKIDRERKREFISEILFSTFKHNDIYKIDMVSYVISNKFGSLYFNIEKENCKNNLNKIFYYAENSKFKDNEINIKMINILLNANVFSWAFKSFSFERLLEPLLYKSVINKNYLMYDVITDSLNFKANYINKDVKEKASVLALKNKNIDFFKEKNSCNQFMNGNFRGDRNFLINTFNNMLTERDYETADFILNILEKEKEKQPSENYLQLFGDYLHQDDLYDNLKKIIFSKNKRLLKNYVYFINMDCDYIEDLMEKEHGDIFKYPTREFIFRKMSSDKNIEELLKNKVSMEKEEFFKNIEQIIPYEENIYKYFTKKDFTSNMFLLSFYNHSRVLFKRKVKNLNNTASFGSFDFCA